MVRKTIYVIILVHQRFSIDFVDYYKKKKINETDLS